MSVLVRVYVNERGVDIPTGAVAADAVAAADPALAAEVRAGRRRLTDARGLPVGADTPVAAGAILRVVGAARGTGPDDA